MTVPVARERRITLPRIGPSGLIRLGAVVGCLAAAIIVFCWLPGSIWSHPIAADDAAGHYYMARKLYDQGWTALLKLSTDDSFYPPLFAALTALFMKAGATITAATVITWLVGAAVVFPVSMTTLASWLCRHLAPGCRLLVATATPLLAALIPGHPYAQLAVGPLLAYGLALSLLPALLLAFLICLDVVAKLLDKTARPAALIRPVVALAVLAGAEVMAQPRIVFTFVVAGLPFAVQWLIALRKSHPKVVLGLVIAALVVAVAAVLIIARQAVAMHTGESIFHPSGWFELYPPLHGIFAGFVFALTGGCVGYGSAGLVTATILAVPVVALGVICFRAPRWRGVAAAWLLAAFFVFLCASVPGGFSNLLTAVWYREEHRIVGTVVIPLILVLVCGLAELSRAARPCWRRILAAGLVVWLVVTLLVNPQRAALAEIVRSNSSPTGESATAMLTEYKLDAFAAMKPVVGDDGLVFADPYSGFDFAYGVAGIAVFFPAGNLWASGERLMVEDDFGSGDKTQMTGALCSVMPRYGARFVAYFGLPYRDDYDHFLYYAPFRDQNLIAGYVADGALTLVGEYPSGQAVPFALYRVAC